jgi:glucose-6-phosphate 1-epimerase
MTLNVGTLDAEEGMLVSAENGAKTFVSRVEGHVCSWQTADGIERLYLSPMPRLKDAAIRGGVPIIFPQFAGRGPLPMHGFARTLSWSGGTVVYLPSGDGRLTLMLVDSPATMALWPHEFRLEVAITVGGTALSLELLVLNSGVAPFEFFTALHTYLRTWGNAPHVRGVQGFRFIDGRDGGCIKTALRDRLEIDRAIENYYYSGGTMPVSLVQEESSVTMTQQGFSETVIWNPGHENPDSFPDLPHDGYKHFICIESAWIDHPISLMPGECWRGAQRLEVSA